ncbi:MULTISPECIES: WecB/TagA/CpsF family glycosyltransferase [Clostridium]|uniref:WecB/TagA/CpsF family glycosyltransferase n=1 Tax=Clostridium TaxID=1485 RepID=UPI00069CDB89|nr:MULTISPECIES: WecB/TagA/CpsF family glycosyltransferase [Clostridium]KOF55953.1 UDP-N-acetyl-D-mannosaminuronic acid transferase [Clostridium sp. DMHC 10]MCD2345354.1 WecB/TagA/CpsF family glycosyltransferase [Clostridium guangxiense]
MSVNILGYEIYSDTKNRLLRDISNMNKVNIISGNPEVLYNGLNSKFLFDNFTNKNSIIIPDGVGVVLASKLIGKPVKEKIAGIEVMEEIIKKCEAENKGIYLVGTKQEILEACVQNIQKKYPELKIAGFRNGFFDLDNCDDIIEDIKASKPYAIFVAMGSPRQERFIVKYMDELPCSIYMGVGGSFDIFAGVLKRAPKWMIKLGLEWLYRVIKEPYRIKRLGAIPVFLIKVLINK